MSQYGNTEKSIYILISFLFLIFAVGLSPFILLSRNSETIYSIPSSAIEIGRYPDKMPLPITRYIPKESTVLVKGKYLKSGFLEILALVEVSLLVDALILLVLFSKYHHPKSH